MTKVNTYMNLSTPEDFGHADIVRFDPRTGAILSVWHHGRTQASVTGWAMQPLHFGTLWGPWTRALWCIFGLALAALTIVGLLMYWNRYLRFLERCPAGSTT